MSSATRVGQASAVVGGKATYDPLRGGQIINVYEGDETGVNAIISGLVEYQRYDLDNSDAPIFRLTVYSPDPYTANGVAIPPGASVETYVWELLANLKEKDLSEHPTFAALSDETIAIIQNFLKKPTPGTDPAIINGSEVTLGLRYYKMLLRGVKKFFTEEYVLRYTVAASNKRLLNMAYANTDRTFTASSASAFASAAGLDLPTGIAAAINTIPSKTAPADDYWWSWLKRAPTSRQRVIGKVEITAEYWLDIWQKDLYPVAS